MNMKAYITGSVIVWVSILAAIAVILGGTPYMAQVLPILGAGAFWSIVLVPVALRPRSKERSSK